MVSTALNEFVKSMQLMQQATKVTIEREQENVKAQVQKAVNDFAVKEDLQKRKKEEELVVYQRE